MSTKSTHGLHTANCFLAILLRRSEKPRSCFNRILSHKNGFLPLPDFIGQFLFSDQIEDFSYNRPTPRISASRKWRPISWNPTGSPAPVFGPGTEMAGSPARFAGPVKTSERYMETGSSIFSPILKAGVGDVGARRT